MAHSTKKKDPGTAKETPGAPAESREGTGIGVTTSGIRPVAASGTAAGGTTTAAVLSIYDHIKDDLRIHLFGRGVRSADVEEVMQRLMLALLRRVKNRGLPDDPHAFLLKMAETEAKRFSLERRRHPLLPDDGGAGELPAPSSRQGLDQRILRAERTRRLREGLAKLSPDDAAILGRVLFEELPQAEVAEKLGIGIDAVNARYRRALAKLKKLVLCHCTDDDVDGAA